jgi:hypothetical protein
VPELKRFEFFFEGRAVGYFEEEPPLTTGEHSYVPYRGLGHFYLSEALSSGPQRCYFVLGNQTQFFVVRRAAELHVLEIG